MPMTQGGPPPGGNIIAGTWIHADGQYYYCRGWRPTGEPRLIPMSAPPYGKHVWTLGDDGATWTRQHLPFRLKPGTIAWLLIALAALLTVPWMLGA